MSEGRTTCSQGRGLFFMSQTTGVGAKGNDDDERKAKPRRDHEGERAGEEERRSGREGRERERSLSSSDTEERLTVRGPGKTGEVPSGTTEGTGNDGPDAGGRRGEQRA